MFVEQLDNVVESVELDCQKLDDKFLAPTLSIAE